MNGEPISAKIQTAKERLKRFLNKPKCDHDATSTNTTLLFLDSNFLAFPPKRYAVCSICAKSFEFTIDEKGELKEQNEEAKNNEKGGNS